jgi:hypothetical protein
MSLAGSQNSWLNSEPVPSGVNISRTGLNIVAVAATSSSQTATLVPLAINPLLTTGIVIDAPTEITVITVNASVVITVTDYTNLAATKFQIVDTVSNTVIATLTINGQTHGQSGGEVPIIGSQVITLTGQIPLYIGQNASIQLVVTNTGDVNLTASAWGIVVYSQPA